MFGSEEEAGWIDWKDGNARAVGSRASETLPPYLNRERLFNLIVFATIALVVVADHQEIRVASNHH